MLSSESICSLWGALCPLSHSPTSVLRVTRCSGAPGHGTPGSGSGHQGWPRLSAQAQREDNAGSWGFPGPMRCLLAQSRVMRG